MLVNVLLYDAGKETEGIHSIEVSGSTLVLMFEDIDDAERYCGLLEAQDFPRPSVESIDKLEIENFCTSSGYEPRFIKSGFIPKTAEDRLLLVPPERNKDTTDWNNKDEHLEDTLNGLNKEKLELENIKKRLEDLL
tara:strand:+ start:371 stop:778 length:408 start_codon:yes stop_codon:yes gene_type:complete